jgi:hypothetical protein
MYSQLSQIAVGAAAAGEQFGFLGNVVTRQLRPS